MLKLGRAHPLPMSGHSGIEWHRIASARHKLYHRANADGTEAFAFWCDIGIYLDHCLADPGKDGAKAEDRLLRAYDRAE